MYLNPPQLLQPTCPKAWLVIVPSPQDRRGSAPCLRQRDAVGIGQPARRSNRERPLCLLPLLQVHVTSLDFATLTALAPFFMANDAEARDWKDRCGPRAGACVCPVAVCALLPPRPRGAPLPVCKQNMRLAACVRPAAHVRPRSHRTPHAPDGSVYHPCWVRPAEVGGLFLPLEHQRSSCCS